MALRISSPSRSVSSPSLSASDTMVISSPSVMVVGLLLGVEEVSDQLFPLGEQPVQGGQQGDNHLQDGGHRGGEGFGGFLGQTLGG